MNENRFFLSTNIFINIKTRDKRKYSQKNLIRRRGNFHGGKLTPENAFQENCPPEICPPSPKEKKKKIDFRKYYLLGKM